jgi:tRNA(Met) cytidine acetyltransferase
VAIPASRSLVEARAPRHRLTLVLSGDPDWTAAAARAVVAAVGRESPVFWISDRPLDPGVRPLAAATRLLGGECGLLIYDAWSGFDPDGFGAVTGTLRGGRLLVLLTPPFDGWPSLPDPQAGRIAPWPLGADAAGCRFIARLVRVLSRQSGVVIRTQRDGAAGSVTDSPFPCVNDTAINIPWPAADLARPATPDQQQAIEAILRHARGRPRRPLVLTAHRGRGKSAALGLAAAQLLAPETGAAAARPYRILVTAPNRASCDALFRHAALAWSGSRPDGSGLRAGDRAIVFMAPDACREAHPDADLLLVDEAAGIPAPLLTALLEQYSRVVFATTVHGYEGTGRGFDLRFRETLDRLTPQWRGLTLESPIRWAADDPLESLVFRALLLDAATAGTADLESIDPAVWQPERLNRDALAVDDALLGQVFGLLVLAHYQTRPLDLRLLLDGPGVRVLVLRHQGLVAGTLIAVAEGGMTDPDLLQAVYDGRRRPRGHLLPQTLSAHGGLLEAPRLRYLRVVRIAVHPALARRGLGRRLLRGLYRAARGEGIDLVGTSFGATPGLIGFWSAGGYRPVQIGLSRNAASAEHALVMLRRVSRSGAAFLGAAGRRLEARLPVLLPGPLRRLDPAVAAAVIAATPSSDRPPRSADPNQQSEQQSELQSFTAGHRTLEAALPALAAATGQWLGSALRCGHVTADEAALLAAATAQLRPVGELVELFQASGRAALIERLRGVVGRMLDHRADRET